IGAVDGVGTHAVVLGATLLLSAAVEAAQRGLLVGALCGGGRCVMSGAGRPRALLLRRPFGQRRTAFLAAVLHQLAEAVDLFLRRRLARPLGGTVGLGRTRVLRRAAGER